jgi:hypothetical protein
MGEGKQSRVSAAQRADLWKRWKHETGRVCGKQHNRIRCALFPSGGIAPATRRRSGRVLALEDRDDISRGIASAYRAVDGDKQAWKIRVAGEAVSSSREPQVAVDGCG